MNRPALRALALVFIFVATAAAASRLTGIFVLQGGTPATSAYLQDEQGGRTPLLRSLDVWLTPKNGGSPLRSYTVDMTKLMHMIVISDDFRWFAHVHPALQPSGHFLITQRFPNAATYHVYADTSPAHIGQQVFRFDLPMGPAARARDLSETHRIKNVGPYTVELSSLALSSGRSTQLVVHIRRGHAPASDLHPYLGALAHAVFVNAADLSYVHVHPMPLDQGTMHMDMPGMNMSGSMDMDTMKPMPENAKAAPDMALNVSVHEPGTYKLWLQFRGGKQLYVAPFVLNARSRTPQ